jgi:hypothetical protein
LKDIHEHVAKLTVSHTVNLGMKAVKQLKQAITKCVKSNNDEQSILSQELCVARETVVNELKKKGK